jgi:hypothetical protein
MNRRGVLASVAALQGAAMFSEALAQSGEQITHVDTKTSGSLVQSSVVKADGIQPEGAAPGAKPTFNSTVPRCSSPRLPQGS